MSRPSAAETVKSAVLKGGHLLKSAGVESYSLDSQLIMAHILDKSREYVFCHAENALSSGQAEKYYGFINKRAEGCPVQYITGKCEFYSLDFFVDENVLLPRPETEILVESAISHIGNDNCIVLDIGAGSGCIAAAVTKHCPCCRMIAVDISRPALLVAEKNAARLGVGDRIRFICHDIFSDTDIRISIEENEIDAIISNPPYIETETITTLPRSVRLHEPVMALDGGADGLAFYRRIAGMGNDILKPGGAVFLEIGYNQAVAVTKIFCDNGYGNIKIEKDLSGRDRVISCVMMERK